MGECLRITALSDAGGWASWRPSDNHLIGAGGDAWRYLWWRLKGIEGIDALLPLEAAGNVCRAEGLRFAAAMQQ